MSENDEARSVLGTTGEPLTTQRKDRIMAGTHITPDHWLERDVLRRPFIIGSDRPETGRNLDPIDVDAGIRELLLFWPDAPVETRFVIEYALTRWARGEEDAAERGAIDRKFHGLDFGSWRRVLAAAMAAAHNVAR